MRQQALGTAGEAQAPSPSPSGPVGTLELVLAPDDLLGLARFPGLARSGPSRPVNLVWHDDTEGTLAADGMALVRDGRRWRLELLRPGGGTDWPASVPAPVLGEDASASGLHPTPPLDCAPVAAFTGRRRSYTLACVQVGVLHGTLRGVVGERST